MQKKLEEVNAKAMRDLFGIENENRLLNKILTHNAIRNKYNIPATASLNFRTSISSGEQQNNNAKTMISSQYNENSNEYSNPCKSKNRISTKKRSITAFESKYTTDSITQKTTIVQKATPKSQSKRYRLNASKDCAKDKSSSYKIKKLDKSYENPSTMNMTIQDTNSGNIAIKGCNDLSQIKEKAEPDSLQSSIVNNNSRIGKKKIKPTQQRNISNNEENRDLQNRLEKALNDLSVCKDKFWKEKEDPIKINSTNNTLYSPKNRLKTAPYQFNTMFTNSFYSNPNQPNITTYNEYEFKPNTSCVYAISNNGMQQNTYTSEAYQNSIANEKIGQMEKDYRTLQKQHLLLQHNVQSKVNGKRCSQISQKTLGFNSIKRNSFDANSKCVETEIVADGKSSFWGDARQSSNNNLITESIDGDIARRISNIFNTENRASEMNINVYDNVMSVKEESNED